MINWSHISTTRRFDRPLLLAICNFGTAVDLPFCLSIGPKSYLLADLFSVMRSNHKFGMFLEICTPYLCFLCFCFPDWSVDGWVFWLTNVTIEVVFNSFSLSLSLWIHSAIRVLQLNGACANHKSRKWGSPVSDPLFATAFRIILHLLRLFKLEFSTWGIGAMGRLSSSKTSSTLKFWHSGRSNPLPVKRCLIGGSKGMWWLGVSPWRMNL
jgi:hypothetical protein